MPKLLTTPFASEATSEYRTDIQNSTGAEPNSATYEQGFPPVTMEKIAMGGKPPKGSDLNGVLYDITDNLVSLTKGARYGFNEAYAAAIGGYPLGAVLRLDNGVEAESEVDSNSINPNVDMTGWKLAVSDNGIVTWSGRTQREKNEDVVSLIDMGWKSGGTTDNTSKIAALNSQMADSKAPILFNGTFKYTGQLLSLLPTTTLFRADKPTSMLLIDGTPSKPNTADDEPVEWVEKNTSRSFGTDTYAHNVGAVQGVVRQIGNYKTGTAKTSGVWTAGAFSAETISHNNGTDTAQDWDVNGSAIGLTATAKANGIIASGKIITGIWSEVTTPEVSDTVLDNSAGGSTCVGMEININVRHKDTGYGASKGTTRGIWMNHYPYKNTVEKNWTFGMCLTGGVVRDTDGADWSKRCGYRTGLYMDSIKNVGIEFGKYNNPNEAVGIKFPSTGADRFKTAIQLNNNKINLGDFTGGTWDDGDLWYNSGAGTIYYRDNGENRAVYNTNFLIGGTSIRKKTADLTYNLGTSSNLFNKSFVVARYYTATVFDSAGSGSPEGVLTAGVGSTYRRLDGGAGSSFYVKESGTGNTGWVAK